MRHTICKQAGDDLVVTIDDEPDHQQRDRNHASPHDHIIKTANQYHRNGRGDDADNQNRNGCLFQTGQTMGDTGRTEYQ